MVGAGLVRPGAQAPPLSTATLSDEAWQEEAVGVLAVGGEGRGLQQDGLREHP